MPRLPVPFALFGRLLIYSAIIPLLLLPHAYTTLRGDAQRGSAAAAANPVASAQQGWQLQTGGGVAAAQAGEAAALQPHTSVEGATRCSDGDRAPPPLDAQVRRWLAVLCTPRGQVASGMWSPLPGSGAAVADAPALRSWIATTNGFATFEQITIGAQGSSLTAHAILVHKTLSAHGVGDQFLREAGPHSAEIVLSAATRERQRLLVLDMTRREDTRHMAIGVLCAPICAYHEPLLLMAVPEALSAPGNTLRIAR